MIFKHLPVYFFPSTICFLDDDKKILDALNFTLENSCFHIECFSEIKEFTKFLECRKSIRKISFVNRGLEESYDHVTLNIDVTKLYTLMKDKNISKTISTIVIDYDLDNATGLDVITNISDNKLIKKILLTGVADHNIAIDALHKKLIERYIKKQDPNLIDTLKKYIEDMQAEFFAEQGRIFLNNLMHIDYQDTLLNKVSYVEVFNQIVEKHKIIEGYLLDPMGSYILLDELKQKHLLLAFTEEQIAANIDIALQKKCTKKVLEKIRSSELTYYHHEKFLKTSNFVPITKIKYKKTNIFYCYKRI